MTDTPTPELMTPAEVARLFRVDPTTVARWATSGQLRCVRTVGGHRRFFRSEIERVLRGDRAPADRPELDGYGHTITVEKADRELCEATGLPLDAAGLKVVVERTDGRAGKAIVPPAGETAHDVARALAHIYGATYVH